MFDCLLATQNEQGSCLLVYCRNFYWALAIAAWAVGVMIPAAQAGEDGQYSSRTFGKQVQPAIVNDKWKEECSVCHVTFAPGLLHAETWRRIMADLPDHFGTDASLDAQDNKEITAFLVSNAAEHWLDLTESLRITETAWFLRRHYIHNMPLADWKNSQVKSPANCAACHKQAEQGNYSDGGCGNESLCHGF